MTKFSKSNNMCSSNKFEAHVFCTNRKVSNLHLSNVMLYSLGNEYKCW